MFAVYPLTKLRMRSELVRCGGSAPYARVPKRARSHSGRTHKILVLYVLNGTRPILRYAPSYKGEILGMCPSSRPSVNYASQGDATF